MRRSRWIVGSDIDDQVIDVVVGCGGDRDAVDVQKDGGGEPSETLVAVDHGVVVDDRLEERGGLGPEVGVGIIAEHGGLWSGHG